MRWFPIVLLMASLAGCATPLQRLQPVDLVQARAVAGFVDLDGHDVALASLKGHPVVLSFLQPDQPDSEAQLPQVIRLADAYQAEGVIWVVATEQATLEGARRYAQAHDLVMPIWVDRDGQELADRHFAAAPAHQFLDRQGRVVKSQAGFMSRGQLLEALAAITR